MQICTWFWWKEKEQAKSILLYRALGLGKCQTSLETQAWLESAGIYKLPVLAFFRIDRLRRRLLRETEQTVDTDEACLVFPLCAWCLWGLGRVRKTPHTTGMSCCIWNWSLVNVPVDWAEKDQMLLWRMFVAVNVCCIHHWFIQLDAISPTQSKQIAAGLANTCSSCRCWHFSRGLRRRQHRAIASVEHPKSPCHWRTPLPFWSWNACSV